MDYAEFKPKSIEEFNRGTVRIDYSEMVNYLSKKELQKTFYEQFSMIVSSPDLEDMIFITFGLDTGDITQKEIKEIEDNGYFRSEPLSVNKDMYLGSYINPKKQKMIIVTIEIQYPSK